jgi:hypothetical protein
MTGALGLPEPLHPPAPTIVQSALLGGLPTVSDSKSSHSASPLQPPWPVVASGFPPPPESMTLLELLDPSSLPAVVDVLVVDVPLPAWLLPTDDEDDPDSPDGGLEVDAHPYAAQPRVEAKARNPKRSAFMQSLLGSRDLGACD